MHLPAERGGGHKQLKCSLCETRLGFSPESILMGDLQECPGRKDSDLQGAPMARVHSGKPWKTEVQDSNSSFQWNELKRSLNLRNIRDILLFPPESEKRKDSVDSKCQVVRLGSWGPYNAGFYLNSGTTSSSCMDLDVPTRRPR